VSANPPGPLALLSQVQAAVLQLQSALQELIPQNLEPALLQVQQALHELDHYPGGFEALSRDIDGLTPEQQRESRGLLEQARSVHQTNAGLLQLAIQRNAAMQSYVAQESTSATYNPDGGVQSGLGGQLLGKY
jgi:flagellar biosynthesis/type III secretory pathway chaperone